MTHSTCPLKVGDTVRLNDFGLEQCFGSAAGLSHMKTLVLRITNVGYIPDNIYDVEVDNKDINIFMLTADCFDKEEKQNGNKY